MVTVIFLPSKNSKHNNNALSLKAISMHLQYKLFVLKLSKEHKSVHQSLSTKA